MSLTENSNGLVMPVSPLGGYGGGNMGFGGDWGSLIVLFLIAAMFGGFGNGFGGFGGNNVSASEFPWLLNGQNAINTNTDNGFNNLAVTNGINSINSGIQNLSTQLCNSTAGINQTVNAGFSNVETSANARQMANMQTSFGMQTAMNQGFNDLSTQFANCCCENRLGLANLGSDIARENCADRAAISDGLRDVLANQTANTQRILDVLCQDKIDAKNEKIADLERQLTMANLASSQALQTQQLIADNALQTNALEQYLAPTPRPAYIVQNPNCCPTQSTCGCNTGCGNF